MSEEPALAIPDRETLAELLTEAVEVEHNLMCCYLFAAWSLKGPDEGLTPVQADAVARWRRALIHVAVDEMAHFANANNLLVALGGQPHLGRPNFPVAAGYHPAGVVVHLRRFDRATIDHFVYLERPEGVDLPDGEGFVAPSYRRGTHAHARPLMPTAQDYATVGHLYRGIRDGFEQLARTLGEEALFAGDPRCQLDPGLVQLTGLTAVTDLRSALAAIDAIVEQGEGSPGRTEDSHYARFCAVRDELAALTAADPSFDPARPVVDSPVQRRPPIPGGKTWVGEPRAAALLDLGNAVYNHMLRTLGLAWSPVGAAARGGLVDAAIDLMKALVPVCDVLTRLPADPANPGAHAGLSFAVTREIRVPAVGSGSILVERTRALADGARDLGEPALEGVVAELQGLAGRLGRLELRAVAADPSSTSAAPVPAVSAGAPRVEGDLEYSADPSIPPRRMVDGVEIIEGEALTLRFDGKRCIHARFCVLGAPEVFVGNVQGPWLRPDAIDPEALAAVALRCPSGAITVQRKDGRPDEVPPPVNLATIRENGPYAIHADLHVDGEAPHTRATLCRCGASKRKPFCDGSHAEIGFQATGEPPTGDVTPLAVRGGRLDVRPAKDGPLMVSGNLEILSGTGRTMAKRTKCALCRCGGSANKPFCDGTHARNGFRS